MEIKINRDIKEYGKAVFWGLTIRQLICGILGCGFAIFLHFSLRNYLGKELLSWVCVLGALPFAIIGFLKYNGMPAEQVLLAFIKYQFIRPKKLTFRSTNLYEEILKDDINEKIRKELKQRSDRVKWEKLRY